MSAFIETIKMMDGECRNISLHIARMKKTSCTFFEQEIDFSMNDIIVPEELRKGIVKCRIVYDYKVREMSFTPYYYRKIRSLKIVENDAIAYPYKSVDRKMLDQMALRKDDCDEILIVKDGQITDTSFSNVVFLGDDGLYTPSVFLLNGTKRQQLLAEGVIQEREICLSDLSNYRGLFLINAMLDLSDRIYVPRDRIYFS